MPREETRIFLWPQRYRLAKGLEGELEGLFKVQLSSPMVVKAAYTEGLVEFWKITPHPPHTHSHLIFLKLNFLPPRSTQRRG
jgi:hypothetical protein